MKGKMNAKMGNIIIDRDVLAKYAGAAPPGRAGYARANRQSGAACRLCRVSSKILFHSPQIVKAWGGVSKFIVPPLNFFKNILFVCSNLHFPLVIFDKQAKRLPMCVIKRR